MGEGRRKRIARHLTERELDEALAETDDPRVVRRLCFVKNLYRGDTLEEAAARVGKSQPTGGRWADRWNEGGLESLAPATGGGRPPKLDEDDRERLRDLLEVGQYRTVRDIRHIIEDEFNVTYHPNYIYDLLRSFGMDGVRSRSKRPERPETTADAPDE